MIRRGLEREGYRVECAETGQQAIQALSDSTFDVIVLDANIPPPDGFELVRLVRREEIWTPILMLTARDGIDDRVAGLDSGADDYLVKPFAFNELYARLRAITRREVGPRPVALQCGDLALDPAGRRVSRGDEQISLSPKEYALLEVFMRRPGELLTRDYLRDTVWDITFDGTSNVVDVYVRYLREKVDRPFGTESIETVRGAGYRLKQSVSSIVDHGAPQAAVD